MQGEPYLSEKKSLQPSPGPALDYLSQPDLEGWTNTVKNKAKQNPKCCSSLSSRLFQKQTSPGVTTELQCRNISWLDFRRSPDIFYLKNTSKSFFVF